MMSGGHFDYLQFRIEDVAGDLKREIADHLTNDESITTERLKETVLTLEKAAIMLHRVDWLFSGDDGEESFNQRWEEDLAALMKIHEERDNVDDLHPE